MRSSEVGLIGSFLVLMASSLSAQNTFPATGNVGIGTTTTTAVVTILGPTLGAAAGDGRPRRTAGDQGRSTGSINFHCSSVNSRRPFIRVTRDIRATPE